MQRERDMTVGRPARQIVGFALPVLGGLLFQYLYNFTDTLIAGRYLGIHALSGMGAVQEISFLITGFCNGAGGGFSVPVAQYFGAENETGMRRSFANGMYLVALLSLILTLLSTMNCAAMVAAINTPPEAVAYANEYQFIIFCGVPCLFFYNYLAGVIRAVGNSRVPVLVLVVSSILNIVLDYILVVYAGMGVGGTAIATVFAQFVAALICFLYIMKRLPRVRPAGKDLAPRWSSMRHCLSIGLPMGLQFSIMALGAVIMQNAVNALGSEFLACFTAASRISFFLAGPCDAVGMAMVTYAGQNMGAGKQARVSAGVRDAFRILSMYIVLSIVFIVFCGRFLMRLIVEDQVPTAIFAYGYRYLLVTVAFCFARMVIDVLRNTLQGTGHGAATLLPGAGEMLGFVLMGLIFVPLYGMPAALFNHALPWLVADLFIIPTYLYVRHKDLRTANLSQDAI